MCFVLQKNRFVKQAPVEVTPTPNNAASTNLSPMVMYAILGVVVVVIVVAAVALALRRRK